MWIFLVIWSISAWWRLEQKYITPINCLWPRLRFSSNVTGIGWGAIMVLSLCRTVIKWWQHGSSGQFMWSFWAQSAPKFASISVTSDPLQPYGCKLSVLLTFHIVAMPILRLGKHLLIIRPYECDIDLPGVMSFHLVPYLPRLVAMVAKFSYVKEKWAIFFCMTI